MLVTLTPRKDLAESVHKMRTNKSRYIKGYKLSYKSKIMCFLLSKFPD